MRGMFLVGALFAVAGSPPALLAQGRLTEEQFVKRKPAIGDLLPDVTVYAPDGKEVKTSSLRGHYTVLTFGCLT